MPSPTSPARLHVVFARDAPVGVILRRGPSKFVRLILWQTDTDTFTPGQWLKGTIDPDSVSVSPGGKLLAYAAADFDPHSGRSTKVGTRWIAVSRPPYFTALGLWSVGPAYVGHTRFVDDRTLELLGAGRAHRSIPGDFTVGRADNLHERAVLWNARGWRSTDTVRNFIRLLGDDRLQLRAHVPRSTRTPQFSIIDRDGETVARLTAEQADIDQSGRLIAARGGKLLALAVDEKGAVVETPIADFNPMGFESIAPPAAATRWP